MRGLVKSILGIVVTAVLFLPAARTALAQEAETAPPARVGQVARLYGPVSFSAPGGAGWTAATLNYPLTTGDALYTQPDAEAGVAIDWSRIELAGGTELQVARIDQQTVDLVLPQGETFLNLHYLVPGDVYTITTPRGTVTIARNGRYAIRAGNAIDPTLVSVIDGAATLQGAGVSLRIAPGETASLIGANPVTASLGSLITDPFIERMLNAEVPPAPEVAPPVVTGMTGAAILSSYGIWSDVPTYGAIWYPTVPIGWAPYRHGHWAFILPWGWTWIDDYPWGFAPFHYGRWIHHHNRWGWLPAPVRYTAPGFVRPIYAPALVSFFDVGSGISIGIGLSTGALVGGAIGWVPLGPYEPYFPWYRSPPSYVERLNRFDVRDPQRYRNFNAQRYAQDYRPSRMANRAAATVIGADAMRRGDPVRRFGHPAPGTALAVARPVAPERAGAPPRNFGRLPAAPGPLVRRPPAAAPRPAPFATSRGLPVGRPGPLRGPALRPEIRLGPRTGPARPHATTPTFVRPGAPGTVQRPAAPRAPQQPAIPRQPGQPRQPQAAPPPRVVQPPRNVQPARPPQQVRPAQPRPAQPKAQYRPEARPPPQRQQPQRQQPQNQPKAQRPPQAQRPPAARPQPQRPPPRPEQQDRNKQQPRQFQ